MKEQKKNRRSIRAQAFEEGNYPPDAEGLRCVTVMVPDSVEFMAQLAGMVALATKQFNYQNKDPDRAAAVTQLWRDAYLATDWGGCMSCEDVADCIENDEGTGDALRDWLNSNYNFSSSDNPPGVPLPTAQRNEDRAGIFNPGCDLDVLWAQCFQLVEWMNETVSQALEAIEAATNTFEVAGAVSQITGFDELSIDALFQYGNLLQDFIAENYAAAFSPTYRDELACAIFCAARDDCEISLDDLFNLFKDRVEAYFSTSGAFGVLDDVIDYLLGQSIDDVIVADAAFFLMWGGVVLANWLLGKIGQPAEIGTKTLNLLLKLAVNDANDDWILLCTDCPTCPVFDFAAASGGPDVYAEVLSGNTQSQYSGGTGWITIHRDIYRNQLNLPLHPECPNILLEWSQTGAMDYHGIGWRDDTTNQFASIATFTQPNTAGNHSEMIAIDYGTKPAWATAIMIFLSSTANLSSVWKSAEYA